MQFNKFTFLLMTVTSAVPSSTAQKYQ